MGNVPYLIVLLVGVLIVLVDGQLILRNSPAYLAEVYPAQHARRISQLVAVIFHLAMLGVAALVASIGLDPDAGTRAVLARIGVLLLLTALAHAITVKVLSGLRQEQRSTELSEAQLDIQRQNRPNPHPHAADSTDQTAVRDR